MVTIFCMSPDSYQCHALGARNCFVASLYSSFIKYHREVGIGS